MMKFLPEAPCSGGGKISEYGVMLCLCVFLPVVLGSQNVSRHAGDLLRAF